MKEISRKTLRSLATALLRLRARSYDPRGDGACVVISPHQDDEAFGCSGMIHACRAARRRVDIVYLTDGAASHPDHPVLGPTDVANLRRREAIAAMALLDVSAESLHFAGIPDGTLSHLSPASASQFVGQIGSLLTQLQPIDLFIPCERDTSAEHEAAFALVIDALNHARLRPRILQYPIWARWRPQHLFSLGAKSRHVWRCLFPETLRLKRSVITSYVSQTQPTAPWTTSVLPRGFAESFATSEEYFFES